MLYVASHSCKESASFVAQFGLCWGEVWYTTSIFLVDLLTFFIHIISPLETISGSLGSTEASQSLGFSLVQETLYYEQD